MNIKSKQVIQQYIRCIHCDCIITSRYRYDLTYCNCKKVAIDGGPTKPRFIGNESDYIILK